ncbi:Efflux pump patC [Lachnellula arida]|uniref:Efflux pump patC n=1 Tax=Lachnellula arida TaxID=1316785 RepID=A0A8T9B403_9HELO|nr:Efflux pump patC [Lachnellula arida]
MSSATQHDSKSHTPMSTSPSSTGLDNEKVETASPRTSTPVPNLEEDYTLKRPQGYRWFLVCTSLYLGCLIYGLDTTISADIQAAVIHSFNSPSQLTWLGTGFPLASVCGILPASAFYAVFDLKWMFISSMIVFEAGSALCGAAPNMDALIVGRVIAGLGGTGIYIGILNFFSMTTTNEERGKYMSLIGLVWGIGAILGPVVGGAFSTSAATWRWSFYINLVIAAVCAPIYLIYLTSTKPPSTSDKSTLKTLAGMDWPGFILSTGTLVCFTMVLTFASATWAWDDHRTIAMFVVFGVLLALTVIQQHFLILTTPEARMMPPGYVTRNRSEVLLCVQTVVTVTNIQVPLYYIPLYFQFVHSDTSMMAAVRLLPFILVLISANMAAGFLLPRVGYYWAMYLVTGVFMTIGGSLMYTIRTDSNPGKVYGYSILLGLGSGLTFQAAYSIAGVKASLKNWSGKDIQSAVSLQNISQVGGTLLSLLISGQVFQSYAFQNLKRVLDGNDLRFSDAEIRSTVTGTQSLVFEGLPGGVKVEAVEAIMDAMKKVYILSIVAGVLSLVCALAMKKERLSGLKG